MIVYLSNSNYSVNRFLSPVSEYPPLPLTKAPVEVTKDEWVAISNSVTVVLSPDQKVTGGQASLSPKALIH